MAAEQEKWISIMIVPEDGAGMRKWRVTRRRYSWFKAGFWFMCLFLFIGFASMVSVVVLFGKLKQYKQFNRQLIEATSKLDTIAARLDRYKEKESKLRAILGSDLELPGPKIVEPEVTKSQKTSVVSAGVLNELEQAIADEDARIRKLPTTWPVNAWQITKKFRNTGNPRTNHHGIDIIAPLKTGVVAAGDGKVTFIGKDRKLGQLIIIDHGNGWETKYGHNKSILVKYGEVVQKGHMIAVYGGSDGSSSGAHLHFGMFYRGQPVDPLIWLEDKPVVNLAEKD